MTDFSDFILNATKEVVTESYITLASAAGGGSFRVEVEPGSVMTIAEAISAADLTVATNNEYYVDGSKVSIGHEIAAGANVTIVGNVKGG